MTMRLTGILRRLYAVLQERGMVGASRFVYQGVKKRIRGRASYQQWIRKYELTPLRLDAMVAESRQWPSSPTFSVVVPVYNPEETCLREAIASVREQIYPHWELCLADDCSTAEHVRAVLEEFRQCDSRIKVCYQAENAGISVATNAAIAMATGDYLVFLDHDDRLTPDALYENAKLIVAHPEADYIYSDEDQIDANGRRFAPFFKPDWSPEYLQSCMYTCHLSVYRRRLVEQVGGLRSEFDGSQDYDLALRVTAQTEHIHHIPKILYHWRLLPSSVTSGSEAKPWAYVAAQKALNAMIAASNYPGHVEKTEWDGFWRVRRQIQGKPLVSIVIPSAGTLPPDTDDGLSYLENCIQSIQQRSSYPNFEIIVVDGCDIPKALVERLSNLPGQIEFVHCQEPFNFSQRINRGAAIAQGEFLLLLNDDVEVQSSDWIESMLEFSQQPNIGAVGSKLLFPNGTLQHVGVIIQAGSPTHCFHQAPAESAGYFRSNVVNRNCLAVTAACLMVRKAAFHQVSGLDESFPLNYNDVDFCLKLHEQGLRNVFTPYAELVHYESASRETGLKPGEWKRLNDKWSHYLGGLTHDPYYNANFSTANPNFELA